MKTLLICHEGALLDQDILCRWLGTFSDVVGMVVLRESAKRKFKRIRNEAKRSGLHGLLDVSAFRIYYRLKLAAADAAWERSLRRGLNGSFPKVDVPVIVAESPNSGSVEQFIKEKEPDIIIARCKVILARRIFSLAKTGTFVMHPGVCPEYRNAHGCFWALVNGDFEKVGMTLLRVDEGVDTGPIYGYYSCDYDSLNESHVRIQSRVVVENLEPIKEKLIEIFKREAEPIRNGNRRSQVWGQPRLTKYVAWKRRALREGK